ncbi:MAG: tetratricopeptide repeat protein [Ignavibacteriaceae bacterium]|nr:tetratricopeptide repeat protein [Ignavibacteriaceae bacterium]
MNKGRRQLAAIMFTDMVGYTALMQEDEKLAKQKRDRHRQVLQESIMKYNGEILQYYGDGTLSMFSSGVEAVKCAITIQKELKNEPAVPLRIGLHTGDVVYEEEGIYGDGVNVASRLESLSVAGSILISEKLQDELTNHPDLITKPLGRFKLKNVKKPLEVYAVSANGLIVPSNRELSLEKVDSSKSIAVIPFINMSTDPENEYFSDGITEEILNALVKVEGLQVTSRTSSFAFKGKSADVKEIAEKLNVHSILEGSVRKSGNKVRITAQLINAADDFHVWSETYDRNLEDIFEVQDEISRKIANTLREKLTLQQKDEKLVTPTTENLDAYNLYLKGKYHLFKWSPENTKIGIEYLNKVIEIENEFAPAYSMLSFGYTILGAMGQIPTRSAFKDARDFANKAIELDDSLAEAYVSLGLVKIFSQWNLEGAEKAFDRALELNPGDAGVHNAYSWYLAAAGKFDEAIETAKHALKLDPLSLAINNSLGDAYLNAGRYEEAIVQLDKTLELDPNFRSALESKGWALFFLGETKKSIKTFKKYQKKTKDPLKGISGLGHVYAKTGQHDKAYEIIDKLKQRQERDKNVSLFMDFLVVYAGLNDLDNVFYYLRKSLEDGNIAFFLRIHPLGDDIRKDPRFDEIMNSFSGIKR